MSHLMCVIVEQWQLWSCRRPLAGSTMPAVWFPGITNSTKLCPKHSVDAQLPVLIFDTNYLKFYRAPECLCVYSNYGNVNSWKKTHTLSSKYVPWFTLFYDNCSFIHNHSSLHMCGKHVFTPHYLFRSESYFSKSLNFLHLDIFFFIVQRRESDLRNISASISCFSRVMSREVSQFHVGPGVWRTGVRKRVAIV